MLRVADSLVVFPRRGKLLALCAVSLALLGMCYVVGKSAANGDGVNAWKAWLAVVVGVPFFGIGFFYLLYRAIAPSPLVSAGVDGVMFGGTILSGQRVAWDEVEGFYYCTVKGQRMVGMALRNQEAVLSRMGVGVRWLAKINAGMTGCAFHVPQSILPMPLEELVQRMERVRAGG